MQVKKNSKNFVNIMSIITIENRRNISGYTKNINTDRS